LAAEHAPLLHNVPGSLKTTVFRVELEGLEYASTETEAATDCRYLDYDIRPNRKCKIGRIDHPTGISISPPGIKSESEPQAQRFRRRRRRRRRVYSYSWIL